MLILSCYKATFLIEKDLSGLLLYRDRLRLKMHFAMCGKCFKYQKQSLFIDNIIKSYRQNTPKLRGLKLADASKLRIQNLVNENLRN